jgi:preprotein translocase subunit SecD
MMTKWARFNIYLMAAMALLLTCGCKSAEKKKKELATEISLHLETNQDGTEYNETVPIYRESPIYVNIEKSPFLDTADIEQAKLVDDLGSFSIQLKMNWHGTQVLQGVTTGNRGKRIAIFGRFGKGPRWLGAPVINKSISDGVFTFTPDASREEAERIVRGLNNISKALKENDSW